jgi:hypothetical protein
MIEDQRKNKLITLGGALAAAFVGSKKFFILWRCAGAAAALPRSTFCKMGDNRTWLINLIGHTFWSRYLVHAHHKILINILINLLFPFADLFLKVYLKEVVRWGKISSLVKLRIHYHVGYLILMELS